MSGLLPLTEQINSALIHLSNDIDSNRLRLPSPPDKLLQLRKLLQQDADPDELATLLSKEPHISARLIKLANSVLFNSRFHVSSVKSAVVRLGMQKVTNLVTGFAITQSFLDSKTRGIEKFLNNSWQTSNQVAALSSTLARHFSDIAADEALLAGQIHNIGEPALLMHLNTLPELAKDNTLKDKVTVLVLKRLSAQVSSAILRKWLFTEQMIRVPLDAQSPAPRTSDTVDLAQLVHLSVLLKHCDFGRELISLPEALTQSPAFGLLWQNEEHALEQLNSVSDEIITTQKLLLTT